MWEKLWKNIIVVDGCCGWLVEASLDWNIFFLFSKDFISDFKKWFIRAAQYWATQPRLQILDL
jgi:hypothetical protein